MSNVYNLAVPLTRVEIPKVCSFWSEERNARDQLLKHSRLNKTI